MSIYYLDASAWVKRHQQEDGSEWMGQFWRPHVRLACATLGLIKVLAAVARRHAANAVGAEATSRVLDAVRGDYNAFTQIALDEALLNMACELAARRRLRGADCVHLASAMLLRQVQADDIVVITSDAELLNAACGEGFAVLDPASNPALPEQAR